MESFCQLQEVKRAIFFHGGAHFFRWVHIFPRGCTCFLVGVHFFKWVHIFLSGCTIFHVGLLFRRGCTFFTWVYFFTHGCTFFLRGFTFFTWFYTTKRASLLPTNLKFGFHLPRLLPGKTNKDLRWSLIKWKYGSLQHQNSKSEGKEPRSWRHI